MWNFLRRVSETWPYEDAEPQHPPRERLTSFNTTLPSALEGAFFIAAVTVRWLGDGPEDLARVRYAARDHLAQEASHYHVTAMDQLADSLNSRGTTKRSLPGTNLVITYLHVSLTASAEALDAAAAWHDAQRQSVLDHLRRQRDLRELRWLRDEIFRHPDIARMYWHIRHPTDLASLTAPVFDAIAACLTAGSSPNSSREKENLIGNLIVEFVDGLDADERGHLISQVSRVFRSFDRGDLADRLPADQAPTGRTPA